VKPQDVALISAVGSALAFCWAADRAAHAARIDPNVPRGSASRVTMKRSESCAGGCVVLGRKFDGCLLLGFA